MINDEPWKVGPWDSQSQPTDRMKPLMIMMMNTNSNRWESLKGQNFYPVLLNFTLLKDVSLYSYTIFVYTESQGYGIRVLTVRSGDPCSSLSHDHINSLTSSRRSGIYFHDREKSQQPFMSVIKSCILFVKKKILL